MNRKPPFLIRQGASAIDLDWLARRATPSELHGLYRQIFGATVPAGSTELARRKIAWHTQSERGGGLPESARQHALAIAREASLRIHMRGQSLESPLRHATVTGIVSDHDSRLPMAGSSLVKEYRGRTIVVRVLDNGFEYDGRNFTSLSAIAKEITGTKWNGFLFFGLAKEKWRGR